MATVDELLRNLKAAEQVEKVATAAHEAAESLGSGSTYDAAFKAMADARAALQAAEEAYDAAVALKDQAD